TPQPTLSDMLRRGIELLQIHRGGYLLVVDAGLMRQAAEQNDVEGTLAAMLELDRAISVAQRYAGAKTTIFVCGDVAVGGMSVNGLPLRSAGRSELLGDDSLGQARVTWASGPMGPKPNAAASSPPVATNAHSSNQRDALPPEDGGEDAATASPTPADGAEAGHPLEPTATAVPTPPIAPEPQSTSPAPASAAIYAPAALNTVEDVIAFGDGLGAEPLHGTIDSTGLFEIIRDNL
ncbi:MAG TPA: alkaline phosphatase, partial [Chthoniobacterales bacterium]|nr:alkaline phosphatase [Chthoniobacterales bacterium]